MDRLPSNAEAEAAILGGILLRGGAALAEVQGRVLADEFYDPRYRAVYSALESIALRGEPIDVVTLELQLRATDQIKLIPGGIEGLNRLGDRYSTAHNIAHHARLVRRAAQMREIVITCSEVTAEARDDHADVDEWMNGAERRIYKAFERQQLGTVKELPALGTMLFEDLVSRRDPETGKRLQQPIVPSGYAPLDHYLDGGMSPGEFVIIAARPSMGKTAFVLNIALNNGVPRWNQPVEEVQPVLFFSMEMSHTQIARRIAGIEAGIPVSRLKRGDLDARLMLQLVREMNRVQRGHVAVDEEGGLSINELRARARRWRADPRRFQKGGKQIGLIVVDYMQLATAGGERLHRTPIANREQEVSAISRGLKAMAKELHLPVIGLSQLNRAVDSRENHRPILSDLRESGAIEQDADVIMFVYRGARYLPPKPTPEQRAEVENKAEIIIGKARDGQTNTAHLYFFEDTQKFADVEHQTVPAAPLIPQENWAP